MSPQKKRQWLYAAAAGAILLLAIVLRCVDLEKGMKLDEYSSLEVSSGTPLGWFKLWRYVHPPLYFLLLRVLRFVSSEVVWVRLPSVLAGVAMVVVVLAWLRPHGRIASLVGGLLTATHPEHVHYSQEIRHYALLLLWVVLAFALADRAVSSPKHPTLALAGVLAAAVATHVVAVFVWTSVLLYLGLRWLGERSFGWRTLALPVLLPTGILALLAIPALWIFDRQQPKWWLPPPDPAALTEMARIYLGINSVDGCAALAGLLAPWLGSLVWLGLVGAFGVLAVALVARRPDRRCAALFVAAVGFAVQMLAVSLWFFPVLMPRTGLPFVSLVLVVVALQVARIETSWWRAVALAAVLAVTGAWASWWLAVDGHQSFEPWRDVTETLKSQWREGDVVVLFPHYIAGPVVFYFPELKTQAATVPVRQKLPVADLQTLAAKVFADHPALQSGARVWVISRADPNLLANQEGFDALMAELARLSRTTPTVVDARHDVALTGFLPASATEPALVAPPSLR